MKIGNVELKNGLILAPMAGYTDMAMRRLCKEMGADLCVSEMISAKAVLFGDKKTLELARLDATDGVTDAIQLFGSDPETIAVASEILLSKLDILPSMIDINMGCPVNKIFTNGEGSALMKNPPLIEKIVKAVKKRVNIPVTVKMRTGVNEAGINAPLCAKYAESGGADAICVHGRTRVQMYSGSVDKDTIKEVKKSVSVPVIANGDITSAVSARQMLEISGADGLAIGRGSVGNPFIFAEISAYLEGREYTPPTLRERVETALYQLRLAIEEKGEGQAVLEARKQIGAYVGGYPGAAAVRGKTNLASTYSEIEKIFEQFILRSQYGD